MLVFAPIAHCAMTTVVPQKIIMKSAAILIMFSENEFLDSFVRKITDMTTVVPQKIILKVQRRKLHYDNCCATKNHVEGRNRKNHATCYSRAQQHDSKGRNCNDLTILLRHIHPMANQRCFSKLRKRHPELI